MQTITATNIPIDSIESIMYKRYKTPTGISLEFVKSCNIIDQQIVQLSRTDGINVEYSLRATIIKLKDNRCA